MGDDGPTPEELQANINALRAKLGQMGDHFNSLRYELDDLGTRVDEALVSRPQDVNCPSCGEQIRIHQDGLRAEQVDDS